MSPELAGAVLAWVVLGLTLLAGFQWAIRCIDKNAEGKAMRRTKRGAYAYRPVELSLPSERAKKSRWGDRLWICITGALIGSGAGLMCLAIEKAGYFA